MVGNKSMEVAQWSRMEYRSQYQPIVGIIMACIFYLIHLRFQTIQLRNRAYAITFIIRFVLVSFTLLSQFLKMMLNFVTDNAMDHSALSVAATLCTLLSYGLLALISLIEYKKGATSGFLLVCYFFLVCREFPSTQFIILQEDYERIRWFDDNPYYLPYTVVLCSSALAILVNDLCIPRRLYIQPGHTPKEIGPVASANILSRQYASWIFPKIIAAKRRDLNEHDLFDYPETENCENTLRDGILTDKSANNRKNGRTLIKQMLKVVFLPMLPSLICTILSGLLGINNVYLLKDLFIFLETSANTNTRKGVYLCIALGIRSLVCVALGAIWYFDSHYIAARLKAISSGLILSKVLSLTAKERLRSISLVTTLLTLDVQKMCRGFTEGNVFHFLFIQYPLYMVIMWQVIGPSALIGYFLVIVTLIFQTVVLRRWIHKQKKIEMKWKTLRVGLLRSVISGIKVVKSYAWEYNFMKRIYDKWLLELVTLWKVFLLNHLSYTVTYLRTTIMLGTMLPLYMVTSAVPRFSADQLFILLTSLTMLIDIGHFLTPLVAILSQAYVSLRRIQDFLDKDESHQLSNRLFENNGKILPSVEPTSNQEVGSFMLKNASFSWGNEAFQLKALHLTVKPGELVAVIGKVGCGKTSLLQALLGEMPLAKGQYEHQGTFAYMPQEPWILNTTLRENVLLGSELNEQRYWETIRACALEQDLDTFPAGDLTEIGERGITLSGGQKHRLSLARAVYADADIYLIDDPLSAVDAKVASHLLNNVFCDTGILANKTRIIATHAIFCLSRMDRIGILERGCMVEVGDHSQIMKHESLIEELKTSTEEERTNEREEDAKVCDIKKNNETEWKISTNEMEDNKARSWKPLWTYGKSFGFLWLFILVILIATTTYLEIARNFQISAWTREWKSNETLAERNNNNNLIKVIGFGLGQGISATLALLVCIVGSLNAAKIFHHRGLSHVFKAKVTYFDITPLGRILNWFTQDLNDLEEAVPHNLSNVVRNLVRQAVPIVSCIWISPYLLFGVTLVFIIYGSLQSLHTVFVVQNMRIHGKARSHVYSLFNEILGGVSSIHAYHKEKYFFDKFTHLVNESTKPLWHMEAAKVCILGMNQFLTSGLLFAMQLVAVINIANIDPSLAVAALYVGYTSFSGTTDLALDISEVKRALVAAERISSTENIPSEVPQNRQKNDTGKETFSNGMISFKAYSARYRDSLQNILRNITLTIPKGSKVGIVGRTGAGKSSMTYALLNMLEPTNGSISINGIDLSHIDIKQLRSNITVISQDPVLFDLTFRDNLDPLALYSDAEIWEVLEKVHLKNHVKTITSDLSALTLGNSEDFSLGQKQLLCLARALLRKSEILILDETTASVDIQTDNLVQNILRTTLKGTTLITIAHRINTVLDYDRIVTLDEGQVVEYDDTKVLLENPSSAFNKLVNSK